MDGILLPEVQSQSNGNRISENKKRSNVNFYKGSYDQSSYDQIMKDLSRTYPKEKYFQENEKGQEELKSVLLAYSKYDP